MPGQYIVCTCNHNSVKSASVTRFRDIVDIGGILTLFNAVLLSLSVLRGIRDTLDAFVEVVLSWCALLGVFALYTDIPSV